MGEESLTRSAIPTAGISQSATDEQRDFFSKERLEPIFVVVTALGIGASLLAGRLGAPEGFILAANVISYLAGGWYGALEGIRSLRRGEVNVDLLMVLAAIGAAIVWQNIVFSLGVIAVLVVFTLTVGIPLPLGVVGHEGSTLIVVSNGLRLLAFRGEGAPQRNESRTAR